MQTIKSQHVWFELHILRDIYYKLLKKDPDKYLGILKDYIPDYILEFIVDILFEENANLSKIIFERGDEFYKKRIAELTEELKIAKQSAISAFKAYEKLKDEVK
jgi:hypothetical protein